MKRITITPDSKSIHNAIKELEKYQKFLEKQIPVFLERVAQLGVEIASVKFDGAQYDGTNDVKVTKRRDNGNYFAVVATGNATLFIEFGTGVVYPDVHPEIPSGVAGRGEFGKGKGKNRAWGYYGEAGTNGRIATNKKKAVVVTHGNPANMCMYLTAEELRREISGIAKEVFEYQ
ncbi:MAG TPA: hypothetical protein DCO72_00200 [Ruminococcus sp.]|nr:hypothetical protein [Ruminococcus sp.]